jgi:hypothetical protein
MGSEFHLQAILDDGAHPRIKPPPQSAAISAPFSYSPSDDGTDENLLVLLHGLGSHRLFVDDGLKAPSHIRTYLRGYPHPFQQIGLFFQATPDGGAGSACTRAVRHYIS